MKRDPAFPDEPLRPHEYDGIQEFDNRLPNWWLWTFYVAIIIAVLYWVSFYTARTMSTDAQQIAQEVEAIETLRLEAMGDISNESLWAMSQNSAFVTAGKAIYLNEGTCVTCHGPNLEGGIGLNLADATWKWIKQPMDVYTVVAQGSPDPTKGMQAWMGTLGPEKVSKVTAYLLSHHQPGELTLADDSPRLAGEKEAFFAK